MRILKVCASRAWGGMEMSMVRAALGLRDRGHAVFPVCQPDSPIAEHLGAPVSTTLQGMGAFPGDHPLHAGMGFGPSAVPASANALKDCDVMLAVGTRFAEICTGSYGAIPPEKLIHIDINDGAIGANHKTTVPIHADSRDAVPALADALITEVPARDGAAIKQQIAKDKAAYKDEWLKHDSRGRVNPCRFFEELRAQLDDDAIVVTDDGNHTFLTAELMRINKGGAYLSPTDFNCMGYCVPATIAAKMALPDRQVVAAASPRSPGHQQHLFAAILGKAVHLPG